MISDEDGTNSSLPECLKTQEGICEVCGVALSNGEDLISCDRCETPHHRRCFDYNGGCAVYACKTKVLIQEAGTKFASEPEKSKALDSKRPWHLSSWFRKTMWIFYGLGVGAIILGFIFGCGMTAWFNKVLFAGSLVFTALSVFLFSRERYVEGGIAYIVTSIFGYLWFL